MTAASAAAAAAAAARPPCPPRKYVVDQLRCLGILATCEVLKAGMPTRITYKELRSALSGLPPGTLALFAGQPEEVLIAASMWAFEVPADAYQLGRTRVFFKERNYHQLCAARQIAVHLAAATIQARVRGYKTRNLLSFSL